MGIKPKIKVVYFSRKPRALGNFSIETYFKLIRDSLPGEFEAINREMPFHNSGFFKRLGNALYCAVNQGDINHITGDIHYVATFLKKTKTILTVLDCGMLHQSTGLKNKIFNMFWFKIPIIKVKLLTAISTATKTDLVELTSCPAEKIKVIYVSINPNFKRSDSQFNAMAPRILQIGTAPNKNLERLIPALNGISCKLVIIGKINEYTLSLLQQNNIKYELFEQRLSDEEVVDEYKKCDILAFVSTLEGFGMPIVEANTVGRVVITGNTTSMPEIAGNAACIVDAFDIKAISDGFMKIINDETYRAQLIENGFKNSMRFTTSELAAGYAVIYKSMK